MYMTPQQKLYFDNMQPGDKVATSQVVNPADLIAAGKEYIDAYGGLTFTSDYSQVIKDNPIPAMDINCIVR